MNDWIMSNYDLMDIEVKGIEFQTQSLDCTLNHYLIDTDGYLLVTDKFFFEDEDTSRYYDRVYKTGEVIFYVTIKLNNVDRYFIYLALFIDGKLIHIDRHKDHFRYNPNELTYRKIFGEQNYQKYLFLKKEMKEIFSVVEDVLDLLILEKKNFCSQPILYVYPNNLCLQIFTDNNKLIDIEFDSTNYIFLNRIKFNIITESDSFIRECNKLGLIIDIPIFEVDL